jgi:hypothetical protein
LARNDTDSLRNIPFGDVAYILTCYWENRLAAIASTGTGAGHGYDAGGLRVKRTVNGVTP